MFPIFLKEINTFLSSLIGYIAIGVFLMLIGLFMWVFPEYSALEVPYASMDTLFDMAPLVFLFLIPAITMRSFSEEFQTGSMELLTTHPITDWQIVGGKFLAAVALVALALLPTLLYYATIYYLGDPPGNLDSGAILGSYLGLLFLGAVFVAIGLFASSLTQNQIVAFLLAILLCFLMHYGFSFVSSLPVFGGKLDDIVAGLGVEAHYRSISRGLLDSRDMIYFGSIIIAFLGAARVVVDRRRW